MIRSSHAGESIRQAAPAAPPNGHSRPAKPQRWLFRVVLALAAGAAAGAAAWYLWPAPRVTVRTLLHVPPSKPWLPRAGVPAPDLETHQRTQVALVKSRLVLSAALRDRRVASLPVVAAQADPLEWLEREVQADFSVAPEILRLAMAGNRPEDLVVLVKALREAYLREIVERETNQRRERLHTLRGLREKYDNQIKASREEQRLIKQKAGARDVGVRALMLGFLQQQLGVCERELLHTQADLRKARLELAATHAREKKPDGLTVPEAMIDEGLSRHPNIITLQAEVHKIERRLDEAILRLPAGEKAPEVTRSQADLKAALELLEAQKKRYRPEIIRQVRERARADLAAQVSTLQSRIAALEETERFLQAEVTRLRALVQQRARHGADLDVFREDLGHIEELSKRLASEETALEVELSAPRREQVLEPAVVSHPAARAGRLTAAAVIGLACALLAFACLSLRLRVSFR